MLRDNYKIIKAIVVDNYEYDGDDNHYMLHIYYYGESEPTIEYIGYFDIDFVNMIYYDIKDKTIGKQNKINKTQEYLNTIKGIQWLEEDIRNQYIRAEIIKTKNSINYNIGRMSLEQLVEYEELGMKILNK